MLQKAQWLEAHLGSVQHERLEGPFREFYKLRAGQYRILYTLDETGSVVRVHLVGHRRDIYKS
ncbi:MAG: type II toxin-antitoxin system mRNA interferase toxin, RelE/StbE family [Anaerolinea sp.]|nr:type II toxin-antitoxin system mRNA interferase toxin, RelE/StbE family [Anaerolinea sp.]